MSVNYFHDSILILMTYKKLNIFLLSYYHFYHKNQMVLKDKMVKIKLYVKVLNDQEMTYINSYMSRRNRNE